MGRMHSLDERYEHEGYLVGYVPRDWQPSGGAVAIGSRKPASRLPDYSAADPLRELGSETDRKHVIAGVRVVGYACGCGWRAPLVELDEPLEWFPATFDRSEELDDQLAVPWSKHVESTFAASKPEETELAKLRRELDEARKTIRTMSTQHGQLQLRIAQLETELWKQRQHRRD